MKTKLLLIGSILGTLLFSSSFGFAQVVYKEYGLTVDPSKQPVSSGDPLTKEIIVDLDNDGIEEFSLTSGTASFGSIKSNANPQYPINTSTLYFPVQNSVLVPSTYTQCLSDNGSTHFQIPYHAGYAYSINHHMTSLDSYPTHFTSSLEFTGLRTEGSPISPPRVNSTPNSILNNSTRYATGIINGFMALGYNGTAFLQSHPFGTSCEINLPTGELYGQMGNDYYPFRIKMKDNLYHYGWLQLDGSGTSRTLKIAYEATAGAPIITGQTGPLPHCPDLASVVADRATPTICQLPYNLVYDYLDLIASPGGGISTYSYQWRKDGVNIPNAKSYTYSTYIAGAYDVIITDVANKCIDTSETIEAVVRPVPTVDAGPSRKICEGAEVSFTPTVSGSGPFTYVWEVCPGYLIENPSSPNLSLTASQSCYLNFYATDSYGCTNYDTLLLSVIPSSSISITSSGSICPPNGSNMVSFAPTPQGNYHWYKNDLPLSAAATSAYRTTDPGEYYIVRNNECGSVQSNKINVPPCLDYGIISGIIFNDLNNDGIKDAGENGIADVMVKASQEDYAISNADGEYQLFVSSGQTYEVEITKPHSALIQTIPASTYQVVVPVSGITSFTGKDFGLHGPMFKDLQVIVTNTITRPGFPTYYTLLCKNIGSESLSGTINFTYHSGLNFNNATPAQSAYDEGNQTLTFDLSSLAAGATQKFQLRFTASVTLPLGTAFSSKAEGIVSGTDIDLSNNVDTTNETVIGSYDPNDKAVSPIGKGDDKYIASSNRLTYTIRFQNTGTYYAYNVIVKDTIDKSLDLATFKSIGTSHPCEISIDSNRVVTWAFNGIMLPDSNRDEKNSHGFIRYTLKQHTIPENTVIKNKAYIYFDFNQPIVTNEVSNTVNDNFILANDPAVEKNIYSIYPNPAGDHLRILSKYAEVRYSILDSKGRLLKQGEVKDEINISELSQGLYLIKLESKESVSFERFIKQ